MEIFEEFQEELIHRYGNNLHFLDATLHLDEAVPHIHIRKVWTYDGKDGLDISQNKALIEMNFERPHPDKPRNKYNNEKMTFSAFERDLKLLICQKHGLDVEHTPKHPGKASLEKEEAIVLKLQEKNQEYREETERLIDERNHILSDKDHDIAKKEAQLEKVSAELVSEEQKNREIADTNIFDKPKNITMSAQEFRSWQKSAETKESNKLALKAISKGNILGVFNRIIGTIFGFGIGLFIATVYLLIFYGLSQVSPNIEAFYVNDLQINTDKFTISKMLLNYLMILFQFN